MSEFLFASPEIRWIEVRLYVYLLQECACMQHLKWPKRSIYTRTPISGIRVLHRDTVTAWSWSMLQLHWLPHLFTKIGGAILCGYNLDQLCWFGPQMHTSDPQLGITVTDWLIPRPPYVSQGANTQVWYTKIPGGSSTFASPGSEDKFSTRWSLSSWKSIQERIAVVNFLAYKWVNKRSCCLLIPKWSDSADVANFPECSFTKVKVCLFPF